MFYLVPCYLPPTVLASELRLCKRAHSLRALIVSYVEWRVVRYDDAIIFVVGRECELQKIQC